MNIEKEICKYVKNNNVPQKLLASKSGMTENAMSLMLNGKRKLSADEYIRICDALCVPLERFICQSNQTN